MASRQVSSLQPSTSCSQTQIPAAILNIIPYVSPDTEVRTYGIPVETIEPLKVKILRGDALTFHLEHRTLNAAVYLSCLAKMMGFSEDIGRAFFETNCRDELVYMDNYIYEQKLSQLELDVYVIICALATACNSVKSITHENIGYIYKRLQAMGHEIANTELIGVTEKVVASLISIPILNSISVNIRSAGIEIKFIEDCLKPAPADSGLLWKSFKAAIGIVFSGHGLTACELMMKFCMSTTKAHVNTLIMSEMLMTESSFTSHASSQAGGPACPVR